MECSLEHALASVGRKPAGELISESVLACILAGIAEIVDTSCEHAHIVKGGSDHVRDIGDASCPGGLPEGLGVCVAVNDRAAAHAQELAGLLHVAAAQAEDVLGGGGTHLLERVVAGPVHQGLAGCLALGERRAAQQRTVGDTAAALDDGPADEVLGQRRGDERLNAHGTGALAHDRNIVRISAEGGDVVLDPFQRSDLVQHAVVAGHVMCTLGRKRGMGEESEDTETVVEGHEHNSVLRPLFAVHFGLESPSGVVTAAVDP